jgi:hypothetical protein
MGWGSVPVRMMLGKVQNPHYQRRRGSKGGCQLDKMPVLRSWG